MVGVRRGVDTTTAPAIGEPTRAFHDAFSRDAAHRSTAGRTAVAASAAMGDIALKVDTRARAVLQCAQAFETAGAAVAYGFGVDRSVARSLAAAADRKSVV